MTNIRRLPAPIKVRAKFVQRIRNNPMPHSGALVRSYVLPGETYLVDKVARSDDGKLWLPVGTIGWMLYKNNNVKNVDVL